MVNLKSILDLLQYSEESVILYDKNDNLLLGNRLFVDADLVLYYNYQVLSISIISDIGALKINLKI